MNEAPGKPPLVYLCSAANLPHRAIALFGQSFCVYSLAGPGKSDTADTMLAAARTVSGGEPFSLWAADHAAAVALEMSAAAPESIRALVLEAPPPPDRDERVAALGTIPVPTLVVYGTCDDVNPPETGRIYREKMPNCNYVLIYAAGHAAASERPEAFTALLSDFLTRREAFVVTQRSALLNP